MSDVFDLMLSRLPNAKEQKSNDPRIARQGRSACPAHGGTKRSVNFSVSISGTPLIHCFAGCQAVDVLAEIDLNWVDLLGSEQLKASHGHINQPIVGWVQIMAGIEALNEAGFNLTFTNPADQDAIFTAHHTFCFVLNKVNELVKIQMRKGLVK